MAVGKSPDDRRYTVEHEWIKADGDQYVVGITAFAQDQLGDIVYVELPKVGDQVEAKFTGVDRKSRTISLSIKAKEAHEEAEAVQSYRSETATSGTSLGDLLKEQIESGESR